MLKKMMKHLVNNPGLKVLSLLLSVMLWVVVVKVADPDANRSFSVSVEILNKNVITEMGKVPGVVGNSDIAMFSITGPRSYVEKMSSDDFKVTADLSQLDLNQDGDVKLVPIEITAKKNEKWITIMQRTVNLQITLEDLSEKKFVITPEVVGTPAEGCAIGAVEVVPNLLTISGPESIVSRISRVSAAINVDGVSSDVTDNVVPTLYDKDEKVIASDLLEMNQGFVIIKAKILGTKSVPIHCQVSGTPAEGYEYRGLEYAPETVLLKGEASLLNSINAINIPEDVINIDGMREDTDVDIDLNPYLAEVGLSLVDETANRVAVRVLIEEKETKEFTLPVERINVAGLKEDHELTYSGTSVKISVRALKEDMDTLQTADINAALDVSELAAGVHTLQLNVTLPSNKFEVVGDVNVQITIEDKNAESEEDSEEDQEEGNGPGAPSRDEEEQGQNNGNNRDENN